MSSANAGRHIKDKDTDRWIGRWKDNKQTDNREVIPVYHLPHTEDTRTGTAFCLHFANVKLKSINLYIA